MGHSVLKLELTDPKSPSLNEAAAKLSEAELQSDDIQLIVEAMYDLARGKGKGADSRQILGLAAPQVGIGKAIIMVDVAANGMNQPQELRVFINPQIVSQSIELVDGREGCWSTGNICGNVERSREVVLVAVDRYGKPVRETFRDFTARLVQHECDHLRGIRFPDRITDGWRLHWVEPGEFDDYRVKWMNWPHLCSRERWEALKAGR